MKTISDRESINNAPAEGADAQNARLNQLLNRVFENSIEPLKPLLTLNKRAEKFENSGSLDLSFRWRYTKLSFIALILVPLLAGSLTYGSMFLALRAGWSTGIKNFLGLSSKINPVDLKQAGTARSIVAGCVFFVCLTILCVRARKASVLKRCSKEIDSLARRINADDNFGAKKKEDLASLANEVKEGHDIDALAPIFGHIMENNRDAISAGVLLECSAELGVNITFESLEDGGIMAILSREPHLRSTELPNL